jgi:hypothetical protein
VLLDLIHAVEERRSTVKRCAGSPCRRLTTAALGLAIVALLRLVREDGGDPRVRPRL